MGLMTQEHRDYLNNLRRSGVTNMFGAGVYIERDFSVDKKTARVIVLEWMRTFDPAVDE